MRPLFLLLALVVSVPVLHADDAAEAKAIRTVLDEQVAAWNKGDLEGFMKGYWKSKDLTFVSGKDVTRGWEETLARYKKRYQSDGKEMGKLAFKDVEIKVLAPGVATVTAVWELTLTKETVGGRYTLIVKKFPEGWRVIHDHTS